MNKLSLPVVSIIIPNYNRADIIIETLDSIKAQSFSNWECIIVDDGSTDNSVDVISRYCNENPKFNFFERPDSEVKGANSCRNYGLSIAKGEYINWVDSDDVLTTNHLEVHSQFFNNPTTDVSVTGALVFEGTPSNTIRKWSNIHPITTIISDMISLRLYWPIGGCIWRKEALKTQFRIDLSSSQEWVFHLEQIILGAKPEIIDEDTYLARSHDNRIGKDKSLAKIRSTYKSRQLIVDKYEEYLNEDDKKIIIEVLLKSIRNAIKQNEYKEAFKYWRYCLSNRKKIKNLNKKMLKVLFYYAPLFLLTRKGETFFKL